MWLIWLLVLGSRRPHRRAMQLVAHGGGRVVRAWPPAPPVAQFAGGKRESVQKRRGLYGEFSLGRNPRDMGLRLIFDPKGGATVAAACSLAPEMVMGFRLEFADCAVDMFNGQPTLAFCRLLASWQSCLSISKPSPGDAHFKCAAHTAGARARPTHFSAAASLFAPESDLVALTSGGRSPAS